MSIECTDNSCSIKDINNNNEGIENNENVEVNNDDYSDVRIEVKGKILLEKLKIDKIYTLKKKENEEDNYAEPVYEQVLSDFVPNKKYFGIYFTASWCGPCHNFWPSLQRFIQDHEDEFCLLVVSCDTMKKEFHKYAQGKDWHFIDIEEKETFQSLSKRFGIGLLPSLVITNVETRKLVTVWGREAIQYNGTYCKDDWDNGEEGFKWWHFLRFW